MLHEGRLWDRVNRMGFGLAAGYIVLVFAVCVLTAATGSPSVVGLQWIPFSLVTMPWSQLIRHELDPGIPWAQTVAEIVFLSGMVVNTAAVYIIGSKVQAMRRSGLLVTRCYWLQRLHGGHPLPSTDFPGPPSP